MTLISAGLGMGSSAAQLMSQSASASAAVAAAAATGGSSPAWQGRSIATQKLRLVDFSAFVEQRGAGSGTSGGSSGSAGSDTEQFKHMFVQIGGPTTYSDPLLEVLNQLKRKVKRKREISFYIDLYFFL